jgi:hypothetical protein
MNYYMAKYPNINWFRNRPNMKLQTNNKFVYELTKIKYLVETSYDNQFITLVNI